MIDRHKVETLLRRRFPAASWNQIATATNAIVGLDDEWDEVVGPDLGQIDQEMREGVEFRLFKRATGTAWSGRGL
jgi:hypothetical protein